MYLLDLQKLGVCSSFLFFIIDFWLNLSRIKEHILCFQSCHICRDLLYGPACGQQRFYSTYTPKNVNYITVGLSVLYISFSSNLLTLFFKSSLYLMRWLFCLFVFLPFFLSFLVSFCLLW